MAIEDTWTVGITEIGEHWLSIKAVLGIVVMVAATAIVVWLVATRRSRVWFKTYDEVDVVAGVMLWAAAKVPGRHGQALRVQAQAMANPPSYFLPIIQSIRRDDLAILAPYIDEWIEGKLPPQNLPAEYEDYRPRTLLAFKHRLQARGEWPVAKP